VERELPPQFLVRLLLMRAAEAAAGLAAQQQAPVAAAARVVHPATQRQVLQIPVVVEGGLLDPMQKTAAQAS
jgi:hypothetical protein